MRTEKLDDQFDEEYASMLDNLMMKLGSTFTRPSNIAWAVGGVLTVGFVFSNALFFQTGSHPAALFETRSGADHVSLQSDEINLPVSRADDKPLTRIVFDPNAASQPAPAARPQVDALVVSGGAPVPEVPQPENSRKENLRTLQKLLADLGYYKGKIDGVTGSKTRAAIEAYKANVGLKGIDLDYAELATSARNNLIVTAAIPKSRPAKVTADSKTGNVQSHQVETVRYTPPKTTKAQPKQPVSNTIAKIQAGLRAFGNQNVTVDGVAGSQTASAIKEFQVLFKLPVTGQIDNALIDKMTAVGLIN